MKKITAFLSLSLIGFSQAGTIYTSGSSDIEICVKEKKTASIDLPCNITDLYFSSEVDAQVTQKSPKTIAFILKKEEGSITAVCKDIGYTFIISSGEKCDNHYEIKDKRIQEGEKIEGAEFDKEELLNETRTLLKGMIKGKAVRGYNIKPFNIESVIDNDDYFKVRFFLLYDSGRIIGLVGKVKNYSEYFTKTLNLREFLKKGWIAVHVEGMNGEVIKIQPEGERTIFVVALKDSFKNIPFIEGR